MDLENTFRMTDHFALTRDSIQFNTLQGRRWINDASQTKIEEKEEELRTTARDNPCSYGKFIGNYCTYRGS